jgi:hypothetical protein
MDALRKATETSYFKDKDAIWVKLVAAIEPGAPLATQTSISVSRAPDAAKQVAGGVSASQ